MDPTKGLRHRVHGYRALLEHTPAWQGAVTYLQIAASSRQDVEAYQFLRDDLEKLSGGLNASLGTPDWTPLRLVTKGVPRDHLAAYMRLARVGLITPLRDGMNLVAKEYIAAQDPDDPGVLILSRYAGAALELHDALLVNPFDHDQIAETIALGLNMPREERRTRWRGCWDAIAARTPLMWGESFLVALDFAVGRGSATLGRSSGAA
jgi:trehalose 6-phosphate synthase